MMVAKQLVATAAFVIIAGVLCDLVEGGVPLKCAKTILSETPPNTCIIVNTAEGSGDDCDSDTHTCMTAKFETPDNENPVIQAYGCVRKVDAKPIRDAANQFCSVDPGCKTYNPDGGRFTECSTPGADGQTTCNSCIALNAGDDDNDDDGDDAADALHCLYGATSRQLRHCTAVSRDEDGKRCKKATHTCLTARFFHNWDGAYGCVHNANVESYKQGIREGCFLDNDCRTYNPTGPANGFHTCKSSLCNPCNGNVRLNPSACFPFLIISTAVIKIFGW